MQEKKRGAEGGGRQEATATGPVHQAWCGPARRRRAEQGAHGRGRPEGLLRRATGWQTAGRPRHPVTPSPHHPVRVPSAETRLEASWPGDGYDASRDGALAVAGVQHGSSDDAGEGVAAGQRRPHHRERGSLPSHASAQRGETAASAFGGTGAAARKEKGQTSDFAGLRSTDASGE